MPLTPAPPDVNLLYEDDLSTVDKVERISDKLFNADGVDWGPLTKTTARRFESNGWDFPICMAKTHLSVSANPRLLNVPRGHTIPIRELRVLAGAKQIVTLAGNIITLPGLPSTPNAWDIDLNDDTGEITGILST